jgi:hypothetical protein
MAESDTPEQVVGEDESNDRPLLFLSHKHADRKVAEAVKDLIVDSTANAVRVFMSSDPGSEGPGIGRSLSSELKRALHEATAVVLVYTVAEHDWTYCMWECGLAIDPGDDVNHVYVLQCGDDVPQNFADTVRVKVSEQDDVEKFTRALLTQKEFFPGYGPITSHAPESERVSKWAKRFYDDMAEVLPHNGRSRKWPIWPTMSLEMDKQVIDDIKEADREKELTVAREWLETRSEVVAATSGAAYMFNRVELPDHTPFDTLIEDWRTEYPAAEVDWLDTLAAQLVLGARRRRSGPIEWNPIRMIDGERRYLPGGGSVRITAGGDRVRMSFHCYLRPGAVPVTSAMTRLEKTRHLELDKDAPEEFLLSALLQDLEAGGWHRLPVIGEGGNAHSIVHVSAVDQFIRCRALGGKDVAALTLADLFDDDELAKMFASTFVVVGSETDLTAAAAAMAGKPGCQDVFVTKTGSTKEPVLGWVTDHDLTVTLGAAMA